MWYESVIVCVKVKVLFLLNSAGSALAQAISGGTESLYRYVNSGAVEELHDVMPHYDYTDDEVESDQEEENEDSNQVKLFLVIYLPLNCSKKGRPCI